MNPVTREIVSKLWVRGYRRLAAGLWLRLKWSDFLWWFCPGYAHRWSVRRIAKLFREELRHG